MLNFKLGISTLKSFTYTLVSTSSLLDDMELLCVMGIFCLLNTGLGIRYSTFHSCINFKLLDIAHFNL